MSKHILAPVYMHDFKCLGGECEDTCCQNWDIHLDRQHYELLADNFSRDKDQKIIFEKYVNCNTQDNADDRNYAYIKLNESGFCPFLNQSGLCHVHIEFGVEPLSNICTFFPRVFSRLDNVAEMTGALSCPEVVRRCLFSAADEYILSEVPTEILPRSDYPVSRTVESKDNLYNEKFSEVKTQLIEIINDERYAFEARFYFLANFTYRLSPHYHQNGEAQVKFINEEIKRINKDEIKKQLDEYFFQFNTTEPVAMIVVQSVLQLRIQYEGKDKLSNLAAQIFENYKADLQESDDFDVFGENVPPDILWQKFQSHWETLNSKYGARLETYLTRYVTNCLQREWFVSMPNPFVYIHMLSIRVAILRFLITSHPGMLALLYAEGPEQENEQTFDALVVEVVYLFARSIDHNLNFLQVVFHAILEQQMMSFDYSLPLIKF